LPWEDKRGGRRSEVDLATQTKSAGGVGEAACAACHLRGFIIVVHSVHVWVRQVPVESAGDLVAVGCKLVKGANVGNIWRVLAEVRVEFCGPGESSQLSRVSEIDHVYVNSALVQRLLSFHVSGDSPVERHLVGGSRGSGCREKHGNAGKEREDDETCYFERSFHSCGFFLLRFCFHGCGLGSG